jgi:anti-sigma regulatory factor (Ser/Thr protein kinase)
MGTASPRAVCVCGDRDVERVIDEALRAAGVAVECHAVIPGERGAFRDVALVVIDRATRIAAGDAVRGIEAPVVVVGDDLDDDGLITLMLEAPVSHLVADPHDGDLRITSHKLVSGDLFGLEKYLALGARIGDRVIATDAEKRVAMGEVCAWAEAVGARSPVVHRIASVIDELLMNALHDAPRSAAIVMPEGTDVSVDDRRAILRWACDERMIAISIGDAFGSLRQRDVIDHVRRARDERGRPEPDEPGAGLGLYLVLANVASLIVNVDPGRRTEVVCLFDLARRKDRAVAGGARSLHVFGTE